MFENSIQYYFITFCCFLKSQKAPLYDFKNENTLVWSKVFDKVMNDLQENLSLYKRLVLEYSD